MIVLVLLPNMAHSKFTNSSQNDHKYVIAVSQKKKKTHTCVCNDYTFAPAVSQSSHFFQIILTNVCFTDMSLNIISGRTKWMTRNSMVLTPSPNPKNHMQQGAQDGIDNTPCPIQGRIGVHVS